ncbi:MAG: hypothetical protein SF182_26695 [Deltaproteobacteria bacterium]|nr:hypothetical protein [Deltaproteobacteria bacterium]
MTNLESLTRRLEALERQNRRLRSGGFVVVLVLLSATLLGAATRPTEIEVTKLTLVDAAGKPRAALAIAGGPGLRFYDPNGIPRGGLSIDASGPSLAFSDADGTPRLELAINTAGVGFRLFDADRRARAALALAQGKPLMAFTDADGQIVWMAPQ